jgi:hypothetical protein
METQTAPAPDSLLFEIEESLSPRLQWMRDHDIEVTELNEGPATTEREYQVNGILTPGKSCRWHLRTFAADEIGALIDWAQRYNVTLWNA